MSRRYSGRMNGEWYLANTDSQHLEVLDLDNEKSHCQADEIIHAGNEKPYNTLAAARADGYDHCHFCLGDSTRRGGRFDVAWT